MSPPLSWLRLSTTKASADRLGPVGRGEAPRPAMANTRTTLTTTMIPTTRTIIATAMNTIKKAPPTLAA